ncbi:unnamed protein product [Thlaspi arvense]|uniref:Uncharacterized protein n=1 Tax=Thlaspi arvense TaxID=13288 RepID=A0AAU9RH57_THLAR|nr:unnamed protein product [Thlaspi arvense]
MTSQPGASRVTIATQAVAHSGPAIFSRLASYSMFLITQAFAGHLGDLELAALSVSTNVILGFDFGLLLGMASALETLCGQAFGAKKLHMLGLLGQPVNVAELSGLVSVWLIPIHFSFALQFPLQRFLQSQLKTGVIAWVSLGALVFHVVVSWFFVSRLHLGVVGTVVTLNCSWWVLTFGLLVYTVSGGCPQTWTGISVEAFSGLWEFVKLSAASGVMLWYIALSVILIVMTGNLKNAEIAVDALSIW